MKIGCSSGMVSCAISIRGGWYVWTIDIGRDDERSVLVLMGVGDSWAGPAECCGEEEVTTCGG